MNNRIRILYIAYYFPPLGGVASLRSLKMVKYLDKLGIDSSVLCLSPKGMNYPTDNMLLDQVPASTRIYRFNCLDLSWFFKGLFALRLNWFVRFLSQNLFIPDQYIICRKAAARALHSMLNKEARLCDSADTNLKIAVISSGPPSSLFLGLVLKQKYSMDFICDFRDEWTNNPERLNINYPHRSQTKELMWEARILAAAKGLSYLTDIMRKNFENRYSFLKNKPFREIQNGYDEADFAHLEPQTEESNQVTIVYTGSFYDRRQPDSLWQAISELHSEGKIQEDTIRIIITGNNNRGFVLGRFAESSLINTVVFLEPFTSHAESLQKMNDASALLLYIPSGKNTQSVLTGKIFDYIRSGRPILAIVPPDGLAASIVKDSGLGFVADHMDIRGIKSSLVKLVKLHENSLQELQPNWSYIEQYSRENQAAKLAGLIHECLKPSQPGNSPATSESEARIKL